MGDGPDPPPQPEPTARSPREHRGFDTSFSERLEKAAAAALQRQPTGALATQPEEQGSSLENRTPHRHRSRILLLGSLVVIIAAAAAIGWSNWTVTLPQAQLLLAIIASSYVPSLRTIALDDRPPAGQAAGADARQAGGTSPAPIEGQLQLAREQVIALETAHRAAEKELAQRDAALAQTRAALAGTESEARQQDTQVAAIRQRLETAERRLADVRGELARTRVETADRARGWSEDREHLETDLVRLRLAIERRDAELRQVQREAERSAAAAKLGETARNTLEHNLRAAQREIDTLREAADDAREKLQATAAGLSMREQELMKRGDALGVAEARISDLMAAMKAAQDVEAGRREELPARLETVEGTSDDAARPEATQRTAATNFVSGTGLLPATQAQPTDVRVPEDTLQKTPAEAGHGPRALDQLPAMRESRDLYAPHLLHGEIGSERAVGRTAGADSRAASGLDALRAALTATKHQTEGRPEAEAR